MRTRKSIIPLFVVLMCLATGSCNKEEIITVTAPTQAETQDPKNNSTASARVDTHPLDWENIDFMPAPSGIPNVIMPWAPGSRHQITSEILSDYLKSEGWELLYNTYNTRTLYDNHYLILYNKYRGLVRMYYYAPNNVNFIASAYIVHKMETEGPQAAASPIMNFAGQNIVNVNVNSRFASSIERWQVARSTWYVFQYEMAYDPNMSSYSSQTLFFSWPLMGMQITNVFLNGTQSGTLDGSIQVPGMDLTVSPTFNTGGQVTFNGNSDADNVASTLGSTYVNAAKSAITKGITGVVENTLGGIFKRGTAGGGENVHLKMNAQISLSSIPFSTFLLTAPGFAFPGYNQDNTTGFSPAYNQPLGVFYISNRPVIKQIEYVTPQKGPGAEQLVPLRHYTYEVVQNSFNFLWNPAVLSEASISNVRYDIVLHDSNGAYPITGKVENIGGQFYVTGVIVGTENQSGSIVGARISFDVVPNNGSARVRIAKTFAANMQYEQIITDPGGDQW